MAAAERARAHDLTPAERRAFREQGFFFREAVFAPAELGALRAAAEAVVQSAESRVKAGGARYVIDGNHYVDVRLAGRAATVQLEHSPGTCTVRVIEPCHGLDEAFEQLIDDPRIVAPMCGLIGSDRVALFTDKLNLKRPGEGSRFRWHQDSPYWVFDCGHVDRLPRSDGTSIPPAIAR